LISDPDHGIALNRERLQRIYGLTPAEARLAALLVEGKRLRIAAAELGISLRPRVLTSNEFSARRVQKAKRI